MDAQKEISLRNAISYCIENNDVNTATNRIMEFIRDEKDAIPDSRCCTQLLCLNTHETWDITEGKMYDKKGENQREYIITDDKGQVVNYFKIHFEEVHI